jgi:hypothetical protein
MKSKPALLSLYSASLNFTGAVTEENPLVGDELVEDGIGGQRPVFPKLLG